MKKYYLDGGNVMKKILSLFLIMACLMFVLSLSVAVAEGTNQGTDTRMNNPGSTMNTNNYRTAATDNNRNNWGWLGLIGLAGLAGLRKQNRERT